jgi:alkyl sulfatase BDS1-like metallo-beta-lactamase superfamily hydrolase
MATEWGPILKRQVEVATALGVLCGGGAAIIVFFGGSIPPWYTPSQARADQVNSAQIQQQTVQALGRINSQISRMQRQLDQGNCGTLQQQLDQAKTALLNQPNNATARTLYNNVQGQMRAIPGCEPF